METTIKKTVKGKTIESIFDNCEIFSIRYFQNLDLKSEKEYDELKNYRYEIKIRHAENTDANLLFEEARFIEENMKTNKEIKLKKYAVTFVDINGSIDSLFFKTLKDARECKSSLCKEFKECYIEKISNNGVDYYKI